VPSRRSAVRAEAHIGRRGANPSLAEAGGGFDEPSVPAEAGPCVSCRSSVPAEAGPCNPCGGRRLPKQASGVPAGQRFGQPKLSGASGPVEYDLPKQAIARPTAIGEGGVNRRPTSQAEAGSHRHRSEDGAGGPCPVSR
jgi:hypothetical protein